MNALNARFYQSQQVSFSQTRHNRWPGWERCLEECGLGEGAPTRQRLSVLDVAAGNLRFATFLSHTYADLPVFYRAIDFCPELAQGWQKPLAWDVQLKRMDVVGALLDEKVCLDLCADAEPEGDSRSDGPFDITVCFGFLHHVPTFAARVRLLDALLAQTSREGSCCVSFWRFMEDESLAARARQTTQEATRELRISPDDLGLGDYLLGWQNKPGIWRYCHHFSDEEIDALLAASRARARARFEADGRTGALNAYLVLQRTE